MVTIQKVDFVRSKACLTLDNDQKVWLTRSDFLESGWKEGISVEKTVFEQYIRIQQYPRALNQAVSMLAGRPCSKGEISQSLKRHHYADDVIELVIDKLEKEGLLDDREFCEQWIQHRSRKYGSRRIRQELRYKGVPEETVDLALSEITNAEQLDTATALAAKAWIRVRPDEDPRKARQKIIASLVRKGYSWELARQAADESRKTV